MEKGNGTKENQVPHREPENYEADTNKLIPLQLLHQAKKNLQNSIAPTPLTKLNGLSEKYQANIWLKREDLSQVRSFKIRGAYNKFLTLTDEEKKNGVVCSSAGNHAQGVAFACNKMKIKGTIYMPKDAPDIKVNAVKMFGGEWVEAVLYGDCFDDALRAAREDQAKNNKTFVHAYDDEVVIAGAGTAAIEALEDFDGGDIDYFFLPIGGGGIASGMSSYIKHMSPQTKIIGCEPYGCPSMLNAIQHQCPNPISGINTFVDGAAVGTPGQIPMRVLSQTLRDICLVPEGKCCTTLLNMFQNESILCEPAGTLCVAALEYYKEEIKGKNILCVISGSNNDITRMVDIENLSEIDQNRRHYILVNFQTKHGAIKEFITEILGESDELLSIQYTKKKSEENGATLVGLQCKTQEDFNIIKKKMSQRNLLFSEIKPGDEIFKFLL